ncbi:MAG: hemolysin family protein [Desulfobulbaceae bacterium]|nr:hemolysin family protein [Desulfobulbaceae bacterium]
MIIKLCLAAGIAIVVSALCSIFEAVLYSVPISRVELLAKSNKLSGKQLRRLKDNIQPPITAILTLNTIANTMGAAIAGASASVVFGEKYLSLFSALFTLTILLFSEILPKTVGVVYNRKIAPFIALPLTILVKILAPIIWICQIATRLIPGSAQDNHVSAEEIQIMALLSRKSGKIDHQQEGIIKNIIDLKVKTVRQAMTPRTVTFTLDKHLTVSEAKLLTEQWNRHSRVPIYNREPNDIVGIIMRKDVFLSVVKGNENQSLAAFMKPVHFVPETASLYKVMLDFFERRQHLFCVVDEYGGMTGVISLEDIIEEIVGLEILDESDPSKTMRQLARDKGKKMMPTIPPEENQGETSSSPSETDKNPL